MFGLQLLLGHKCTKVTKVWRIDRKVSQCLDSFWLQTVVGIYYVGINIFAVRPKKLDDSLLNATYSICDLRQWAIEHIELNVNLHLRIFFLRFLLMAICYPASPWSLSSLESTRREAWLNQLVSTMKVIQMRHRRPERGWWITLVCFFWDLSWIFLASILINPLWWVNHFQPHLAGHSLPQFPFDPFRYSKEMNSPTPILTMCLGDESWCQSRCDFDPGSPAVLFRFPPFGYFHCMQKILRLKMVILAMSHGTHEVCWSTNAFCRLWKLSKVLAVTMMASHLCYHMHGKTLRYGWPLPSSSWSL